MPLAAKPMAKQSFEQTNLAIKRLIYHVFYFDFWRLVYQQLSNRSRTPDLGK